MIPVKFAIGVHDWFQQRVWEITPIGKYLNIIQMQVAKASLSSQSAASSSAFAQRSSAIAQQSAIAKPPLTRPAADTRGPPSKASFCYAFTLSCRACRL